MALREQQVAGTVGRFARNGVKVMLGDVGGKFEDLDQDIELMLKEGTVGLAVFAGNVVDSLTSHDKNETKSTFSRRNILKKSLYAASAWAASPLLSAIFKGKVANDSDFEYQKDAMLRIASRIEGWQADRKSVV